MGRKYAIRDQNAIHFLTLTVVGWIDLFTRDTYREELIDSLRYCQMNKGLKVHAYCVMTNHVHLILSAKEGKQLSDIIRDFKCHTSRRLRDIVRSNRKESRRNWIDLLLLMAGEVNSRNLQFQLWQQHNHPIELSTNIMLQQRLDYVHDNPVTAGFVTDPSAWLWSSCAAYHLNVSGPLELDYIE